MKLTWILLTLLCLQLQSVSCKHKKNLFNLTEQIPQPFPTSEECKHIPDCFNCTLSNCKWVDQECVGARPHQANAVLLFKNSAVCGDPLNIC